MAPPTKPLPPTTSTWRRPLPDDEEGKAEAADGPADGGMTAASSSGSAVAGSPVSTARERRNRMDNNDKRGAELCRAERCHNNNINRDNNSGNEHVIGR